MRILSIGNFSNASWDGSQPDEEHIARALEELGHEVFRWQRESVAAGDRPYEEYDFTLIAQWDGYGDTNLIDLPHPLVYWAFDYQDDGQEWHEKLITEADLYLSKPFSDSKYPNWRWLSQDFAPSFLSKTFGEKDIDVLFTGSWVPWESGQERVRYLKAIDERFSLQINSVTPDQWKAEGFKNVQGPVMDRSLPDLIARAKVNFSMDHVHVPGYWSDRNAQIMACGGLVLFKYVPFSEQTFKNNISYFNTLEQCLDGIEYFLECEEDRETLAEEGYHYAQDNLLVHDRVAGLLTIVSLL